MLAKQVWDHRVFVVDLSPQFVSDRDDTLTGVESVTMSADDTEITIADVSYSGLAVSFRAEGGKPGTHTVVVRVTASDDQRLEVPIPLVVHPQSRRT